MMRRMRTSKAGLELVKGFEGFRARAAQLPDGRWTVGYGHTQTAREDLRITPADAEAVLREYDLPPVELAVCEAVFAPLNQNEFDALVSFTFNIGQDAFKGSGVLAELNAGRPLAAAGAMVGWHKANLNGRLSVVDALVRRRAMEQALFLKHPTGAPVAPSGYVRPLNDADIAPENAKEEQSKPSAPSAKFPVELSRRVQKQPEARPAKAAQSGAVTTVSLRRELGAKPEAVKPLISKPAAPQESAPKAHAQKQTDGPTPDEITRAISALANPESDGQVKSGPAEASPVKAVKILAKSEGKPVGEASQTQAYKPSQTPPPFDDGDDDLPKLPDVDYANSAETHEGAKADHKVIIDDLETPELDPVLMQKAVIGANIDQQKVKARPPRSQFHTALGVLGLCIGGYSALRVMLGTPEPGYYSFGGIVLGVFLVLTALFLALRPAKN